MAGPLIFFCGFLYLDPGSAPESGTGDVMSGRHLSEMFQNVVLLPENVTKSYDTECDAIRWEQFPRRCLFGQF